MAIKVIIAVFVLLLPEQAFLMPDILSVEQDKIIYLTNELREKNDLPRLAENLKLYSSSALKSEDMIKYNYFSHTGPDNHVLSYFLHQAEYDYTVAGENLAVGYFDAESMMKAWQASPSHRANLLDKDYTEIGVSMAKGIYLGGSTVFAAQHFGQPRNTAASTTLASTQMSGKVQSDYVSPTDTVKKVLAIRTVGASSENSNGDGVIGSTDKSFWRKYVAANNMLGHTTPVFGLSKMIYLSLIIFFTLALLLNVLVEIKMQHKHVIVRSLALIGVLAVLWLV